MSVNLDLQNWPDSPPPPPPMMNRSAIGLPKLEKANADDANRSFKLAKTKDEQCVNSIISSEELPNQMLSFSGLYNYSAPSHYSPNFTGNYICGAANMHDLFNGPFTPSQWMELEHQALIYKHITSNMPVPSSLLMPIRKALSHAAFPRYNAGHFTSMGWGGFHLGLQNNDDPEPGRCRRTDGKKWRCSRDAVADQKYCERHINRGRHRSRKPVEGHSVGNASSAHLKPIHTSATVVTGNGLFPEKPKILLDKKNLHLATSESAHNSRISVHKEMACDGRARIDSLVPPSSIVLHPRESLYNIHNKPISHGQSFGSDFGLVSSDALKNPSAQSIRNKFYEEKKVSDERIRPHSTPTHQFIDECPKDQPDHTCTMWPNSDDTQLSISIPIAYNIKDGPSSLTLAWEFDSMPMGGSRHTDQQPESEDKHPNWMPVIRDSIIGGPLGEVVQNGSGTNNTEGKNTSSDST